MVGGPPVDIPHGPRMAFLCLPWPLAMPMAMVGRLPPGLALRGLGDALPCMAPLGGLRPPPQYVRYALPTHITAIAAR